MRSLSEIIKNPDTKADALGLAAIFVLLIGGYPAGYQELGAVVVDVVAPHIAGAVNPTGLRIRGTSGNVHAGVLGPSMSVKPGAGKGYRVNLRTVVGSGRTFNSSDFRVQLEAWHDGQVVERANVIVVPRTTPLNVWTDAVDVMVPLAAHHSSVRFGQRRGQDRPAGARWRRHSDPARPPSRLPDRHRMIELLIEMFRAPEAQPDAYTWGAALLGHFALGVILTALVGAILGAWRGMAVTALGYALLWEGGQLAFAGADPIDSFVDALAVACGALVAAGSWRNRARAVALGIAVLSAIGIVGVGRRR